MAMCQCGLFSNCNGSCKFCLIKNEKSSSMKEIYYELEKAIDNIDYISNQENNWTNFFSDGISILGGELFYIQDEHYKELMLKFVDKAIEKVIKVSDNPRRRISTVTNGNYDPNNLLFPFFDRINEKVGIKYADVNFSYDLEYRFANKEQEERVKKTINAFHERYNYIAGVQMILTQHLCDRIINEGWRPSKWIEENLPGNRLALLYPHPINRGNGFSGAHNLEGFNFDRRSLLKVLDILKEEEPLLFEAFVSSCRNSAVFKYTMLYEKGEDWGSDQSPRLSDGKELINYRCGHSTLYQCYSDSDKCMMCDIEAYF